MSIQPIIVSRLTSIFYHTLFVTHILFPVAQENMNLEASYMLTNYVGIMNASQLLPAHQDKVRRPTEGEKAGLSAQYQQEYTTLSSEQIDKLWQIYRYEIFMFDYPYSPFVDFSRA